jgi:arylsulfatase A-like enzyme
MKLIATGDDGPWELYNLGNDRSEQKDLASAQPELAHRLAAKWKSVDDDFTRVRESAPACTKKLLTARKDLRAS